MNFVYIILCNYEFVFYRELLIKNRSRIDRERGTHIGRRRMREAGVLILHLQENTPWCDRPPWARLPLCTHAGNFSEMLRSPQAHGGRDPGQALTDSMPQPMNRPAMHCKRASHCKWGCSSVFKKSVYSSWQRCACLSGMKHPPNQGDLSQWQARPRVIPMVAIEGSVQRAGCWKWPRKCGTQSLLCCDHPMTPATPVDLNEAPASLGESHSGGMDSNGLVTV